MTPGTPLAVTHWNSFSAFGWVGNRRGKQTSEVGTPGSSSAWTLLDLGLGQLFWEYIQSASQTSFLDQKHPKCMREVPKFCVVQSNYGSHQAPL